MPREKTARLAVPLSVVQKLKRLTPIKNEFRVAARHNPLRHAIAGVLFENPEGIDPRTQSIGRTNFAVANQLRIIIGLALVGQAIVPAAGFRAGVFASRRADTGSSIYDWQYYTPPTCVGDFPNEYMYSLLIDGALTGDFYGWPEAWDRGGTTG